MLFFSSSGQACPAHAHPLRGGACGHDHQAVPVGTIWAWLGHVGMIGHCAVFDVSV